MDDTQTRRSVLRRGLALGTTLTLGGAAIGAATAQEPPEDPGRGTGEEQSEGRGQGGGGRGRQRRQIPSEGPNE